MQQLLQTAETARLLSQVTAGTICVAGLAEVLSLQGLYHARNEGPLELFRSEYNDMQSELERFYDSKTQEGFRRIGYSIFTHDGLLIPLPYRIQELLRVLDLLPKELKWEDSYANVVTTVGANLALDTFLAGSSYTAATYLGLISNVSYTTGPAVGDTMTSHTGWTEAGGTNTPTYSGGRKAPSWSAAGSKSKSNAASPATFTFTGGTGVIVKGSFLVYGSGASSTVDNTGGVLYSAGLFTGGDKTVSSGDSLSVTYTANA